MRETGDPDAFIRAAVAGDAVDAERRARALTSAGLPLVEVYDQLTSALAHVGDCWEHGTMSVAHEHRATTAAHQLVARLRGAPPAAVRGSVLLTTLPGERHTLGITVLEHILENARFRAVALGDLPVTDVADYARQLSSLRAILVSAHLPPDIDHLRTAVRQLRASAPDAQIILGGPAFAYPRSGFTRHGADHVRLTAHDALAAVDAAAGPLTRRESEVLEHLANGLTNNQIADALRVSTETVKQHVDAILRKLGVSTRTAAVGAAFRAGLLG